MAHPSPVFLFRQLRWKLVRTLTHRGLLGTLAKLCRTPIEAAWRLRPSYRRALRNAVEAELAFDRAHGVDTAGKVPLARLRVVGGNRDHGNFYLGTSPIKFAELMQCVPVRHEDFVFVDFGSGKGRALLLAADYPFQCIVGVEFSPELNQIAEANLVRYHSTSQKCTRISTICQDATEFELPPENLFLYFYNPFDEKILTAILDRLDESLAAHPRAVVIAWAFLYAHGPLSARKHFFPVKLSTDFVLYANRESGLNPA